MICFYTNYIISRGSPLLAVQYLVLLLWSLVQTGSLIFILILPRLKKQIMKLLYFGFVSINQTHNWNVYFCFENILFPVSVKQKTNTEIRCGNVFFRYFCCYLDVDSEMEMNLTTSWQQLVSLSALVSTLPTDHTGGDSSHSTKDRHLNQVFIIN